MAFQSVPLKALNVYLREIFGKYFIFLNGEVSEAVITVYSWKCKFSMLLSRWNICLNYGFN